MSSHLPLIIFEDLNLFFSDLQTLVRKGHSKILLLNINREQVKTGNIICDIFVHVLDVNRKV